MTRAEFILNNLRGDNILDIGCAGHKGLVHQRIRSSGKYVIGLDIAYKEILKLSRLGGDYTTADAEYLPFKNESFDTVVLGEVIEHLSCPTRLLEECYRVLKSDGSLCITTPNVYSIDRILSYMVTGKDTIGTPDHKVLYTPAVLISLLDRIGFRVAYYTTVRKFTFRGRFITWKLPVFKHLGGNLCVVAQKK
ncbi:MAG: methyltransferase domain-containing protein [Dehalococcoidales bacterium]